MSNAGPPPPRPTVASNASPSGETSRFDAARGAAKRGRLACRLIFLRHGETDWNASGRLQGQKDIPLNARGRDQAAAVGRDVAKFLGRDGLAAQDFIASPMLRTRQTMQIAREAMGLAPFDYQLDERLKEITFGTWEGLTWREVTARDPEGAAGRVTDKWGYTPPEGESYATLCERVAPWLASVNGDTVVVSHGGVARAFLHLLAGVEPLEAAAADIHQGRALIFDGGAARWL
jgi:probable phosphoglycerate mutase